MTDVTPRFKNRRPIVLPAPNGVPEKLAKACREVATRVDEIDDVSQAYDLARRAAAIETYLGGKDTAGSAQTAARLLEARIGELLGSAKPGAHSSALEGPQLTRHERSWFRLLAAHPDAWRRDLPMSRESALRAARAERRRISVSKLAATVPSTDAADDTPTAFSTIVIDPPWRYDNKATRGAAEDHYPTMSLDELAALEVPATDAAHLYLWVTNGFLREGFDLLDAWGFTYKACLTWCKPQIGMGNYFRNATEHIYFANRGNLPTEANNISTWFVANRGRHSAKPEQFYDIVKRSSPGPFLEMFARRKRLGWYGRGNEA